MIDLEQKYIDFIKETVSNHLNEYKLYFFGSRVKNKAKKYSDIDIAIDSADVVLLKSTLTDKFKELITADLVQI